MTNPPRSAVSRSLHTPQRWSCAGCTTRWTGLRTCHCGACHHTFTAVTPFDRHRRGGTCHHPTEVGLVLTKRPYSCWGEPGTDQSPREEMHHDQSDLSGL